MASNKELAEQANALAKDLGVEVKTEGLNNQSLQALVADLTKRSEEATNPQGQAPPSPPPPPAQGPLAAGGPPPRDPPPPHKPFDGAGENALGGAPPAKREEPPLQFAFQVAPRKAITSLKGILGEGVEVRPEFFSADPKVAQETFDRMVEGGYVIEGKRREPSRAGRG